MGIGIASGNERAVEAAKKAIHSPLLDANINGATDAIVNVASDTNIALWEVTEAIEAIQAASDTEINIIYGTTINTDLKDEVIVTVIAAGFDESRKIEMAAIGATDYDMLEPESNSKEKPKEKEAIKKDSDRSKTAIPSWLKSRFK
jgi:cell division protein FtsZ